MAIIHTLKCWPQQFEDIITNKKLFEYRKNDRYFEINDYLDLHEYNLTIEDGNKDQYTGRSQMVMVIYIIYGGQFGIPKDYCIMSIKKL